MKLKEINEFMEKSLFSHEKIKRKHFFMLESFLLDTLPVFWRSLSEQRNSIHLYSVTYDKTHEFNVFIFKNKKNYSLAWFEDIKEQRSDLITVEKSMIKEKLDSLIQEELKISEFVIKEQERRIKIMSETIEQRRLQGHL